MCGGVPSPISEGRMPSASSELALATAVGRPALRPRRVVFMVELWEVRGTLKRNSDRALEQNVKCIDPKHLARKHRADVARDGFGNCVQVEWLAEFLLHRSHRLRCDAAGDDQVEEAEVGVHVEGEAVRGD